MKTDMIIFLNESIKDGEFYHLSSYNFDEFDISKAGTERTSSLHGYGLYFSETPENLSVYGVASSILYKVLIVPSVLDGLVAYDVPVENPERFYRKLETIIDDENELEQIQDVLGISDSYEGDFSNYGDFYDYLVAVIGDKKDVSKFFLKKMGITGFYFSAKENKEGKNIVLFTDEGIRIIKKKKNL